MMELVIKISDRQYELLQRVAKTKRGMENLSEYGKLILNGIPLPKGHGDLIDRDALKADCNEQEVYYDEDYYNEYCGFSLAQVECADVIVKADEEEKK